MTIRTVKDWETILATQDATYRSAEVAAADRILSDLVGYRPFSMKRSQDAEQLGNALQAYYQLCKKAGL